MDGKVLISKEIKLNKVLDLTNNKILKSLNLTKEDITSDSYDITQRLGTWARDNGYDGIIAPSARDKKGTNVIILQNKKAP